MKSWKERKLLKKLKKGEFDGQVGNTFYTSGGSSVWTEIKNGTPTRYKKGPGGKFFDGKENVRYDGKLHVKETWRTDDEKIGFFKKFGWLLKDKDAQSYSAKYKEK